MELQVSSKKDVEIQRAGRHPGIENVRHSTCRPTTRHVENQPLRAQNINAETTGDIEFRAVKLPANVDSVDEGPDWRGQGDLYWLVEFAKPIRGRNWAGK